MRYSGYIEGYYGKLVNWEGRRALVDALSGCQMNAYVYAPKEDLRHRHEWQKAYSAAWFDAFSTWVDYGKRRHVAVIPGISPGLGFDYNSRRCLEKLKNKMSRFLDSGVETLLLSMDDIPVDLPLSNRSRFRSLGHAHGALLTNVLDALRKKNSKVRLLFCPTVYCSSFAGNKSGQTYLKDLSNSMPDSVRSFWTGPDVISETINSQNLRTVRQYFGDKWMIWDNYYATDYCPNRLFLGPLQGRSYYITRNGSGFFINPTGLPKTDIILIKLTKLFLSGQSTKKNWCHVLEAEGVPKPFFKIAPFLFSPFAAPEEKVYSGPKMQALVDTLNWLVFDWKSDLHLEWYGALYTLKTDIQLHCEPQKTMRQKMVKKYTPFLQNTLNNTFKLRSASPSKSGYAL